MREYARQQYPNECCAVIMNNELIPLDNISKNPTHHFEIDSGEYIKLEKSGKIQAIIHSHTNGDDCPSSADIQSQITSNVPWGIVLTDGKNTKPPFYFGDGAPIAPLIGRQFKHGVTDCFSLIRDYYYLEKNILLPDYPRKENWWRSGENLFLDNFVSAGFEVISKPDIKVGDVFLSQIHANVPNHGGVLYSDSGLILHHPGTGLSIREPLTRLDKYISHWLRFKDEG